MNTFTFNCQLCGQSLEAPEDMLGEVIDCPSCSEKIELMKVEPKQTPHLQTQHAVPQNMQQHSQQSQTVETNVKQGALIGGLVCFVLGIIMMSFSLWTVILYAPLFLAAFVLSIVAMAQKRIAGGVILLVLTIIVPPVMLIALPGFKMARTAAQENMQTRAAAPIYADDEAEPEIVKSTTVPEWQSKNPELDARMGFRNFKLGTLFSDFNINDLQAAQTMATSDIKTYRVRNFDSKLGAAEIDSIQLNFNENLLENVIIRVSGEQNRVALRETLIAGYGEPMNTVSFMTNTIRWEGDDVVLTLYFSSMGVASARFSSRSVDKRIESIKLQKARDAAAEGVEGL